MSSTHKTWFTTRSGEGVMKVRAVLPTSEPAGSGTAVRVGAGLGSGGATGARRVELGPYNDSAPSETTARIAMTAAAAAVAVKRLFLRSTGNRAARRCSC